MRCPILHDTAWWLSNWVQSLSNEVKKIWRVDVERAPLLYTRKAASRVRKIRVCYCKKPSPMNIYGGNNLWGCSRSKGLKWVRNPLIHLFHVLYLQSVKGSLRSDNMQWAIITGLSKVCLDRPFSQATTNHQLVPARLSSECCSILGFCESFMSLMPGYGKEGTSCPGSAHRISSGCSRVFHGAIAYFHIATTNNPQF